MKFPTTVKKYRITDYSQLSDNDLLKQLQYFIDKAEKIGDKKYDHKSIKLFFSLFLNFNSLTEEFFKRNPELKNNIDFEGEIEKIFEANGIVKNKN